MTTLPVMTEPDMTISDARAYLAKRGRTVARETIWRWIKAGKLKAKRTKTGRTLYVRQQDLDALLELVDVAA